jgi:hypothetical protein
VTLSSLKHDILQDFKRRRDKVVNKGDKRALMWSTLFYHCSDLNRHLPDLSQTSQAKLPTDNTLTTANEDCKADSNPLQQQQQQQQQQEEERIKFGSRVLVSNQNHGGKDTAYLTFDGWTKAFGEFRLVVCELENPQQQQQPVAERFVFEVVPESRDACKQASGCLLDYGARFRLFTTLGGVQVGLDMTLNVVLIIILLY